jgi:hypothetical protein
MFIRIARQKQGKKEYRHLQIAESYRDPERGNTASTYSTGDASVEDEDIRRFGYSRDGRFDRRQLTLGIVMARDGIRPRRSARRRRQVGRQSGRTWRARRCPSTSVRSCSRPCGRGGGGRRVNGGCGDYGPYSPHILRLCCHAGHRPAVEVARAENNSYNLRTECVE